MRLAASPGKSDAAERRAVALSLLSVGGGTVSRRQGDARQYAIARDEGVPQARRSVQGERHKQDLSGHELVQFAERWRPEISDQADERAADEVEVKPDVPAPESHICAGC